MPDDGDLNENGSEATGKSRVPLRDFLYTLDQVAHILSVDIEHLPRYVQFVGSERAQEKKTSGGVIKMRAVSVLPSPMHDKNEWRVPDVEVTRYLRAVGLVVYERKLTATAR